MKFRLALLFLSHFCIIYAHLRYDYLVIGCGGSGSLFANRLSANPSNRVLVLERGVEDCDECDQSASNPGDLRFQTPNDPTYVTNPQLATGKRLYQFRWNGAGGTTRVYGGIAAPSSPQILNTYPPGYDYASLLPYYNRIQDHYCNYLSTNYTGITPAECVKYHGQGGPMTISSLSFSDLSPLSRDLVGGVSELNISYSREVMNATNLLGLHPIHFFRNRENRTNPRSFETRESTWTGYLPKSVRNRENLDIIFGAQVTRLLYNPSRTKVTGVEYWIEGSFEKIQVRRQVILAAGNIESPKILQLSGIGPKEVLNKFGIKVVYDNPHVGRHLKGHPNINACYSTTQDATPTSGINTFDNYILFSSSGLYNGHDVEIEVLPGACVDTLNYDFTGPNLAYLTTPNTGNFISFIISAVRTQVEGSVEIASPYFWDRPNIDFNWTAANTLPTSNEYRSLMHGFELVTNLTSHTQWGQTYITSNVYPGSQYYGVPYFYFLYGLGELYHLHGTNAMGKVTDSRGRVNGVQGLTICDSSLLSDVDANPTMTMLAFCEKIAENLLASCTLNENCV